MAGEVHYVSVILDQDADGNRSFAVRTSPNPAITDDIDTVATLGPVTVGPGQPFADDDAAVAALAEEHGLDLKDPTTWDVFFEDTLEDEGVVIL